MSKNNGQFREGEVVILENGDEFPKIAGRLRLLHETSEHVEVQSQILTDTEIRAVVKSTVKSDGGLFEGIGSANADEDTDFLGCLVELAQTRSLSRALRWAGYGLDSCGIEEIRKPLGHEKPSRSETAPATTRPSQKQDLISQPQIKLIYTLAKSLRMGQDDVFEMILAQFQTREIEELSKKEASETITHLKSLIAKQKGNNGKGNGRNHDNQTSIVH